MPLMLELPGCSNIQRDGYDKVSPSNDSANTKSVTSQSFSLFLPASSALPMLFSPGQGEFIDDLLLLVFFTSLNFREAKNSRLLNWDGSSVEVFTIVQFTLLLPFT